MKNVIGNRNNSTVKRNRFKFDMRAYYALAIVFSAVILLILCLTVFFRITDIKVEGVTLYREDQIVNVGGVQTQMNLVRTDTDKIVDRLENNLVYIDEVEVKKQYPSTIVISCKEAVKAADIEYKDSYYVLSSSGRILEEKNPKPTGDIPVVTGFKLKSLTPGEKLESEDSYKAKILMELLEEFDRQEVKNIKSIDMKSRADIIVNYDGRIEIKLGSSADIAYKISYFKAVIGALSDDYEGTLIYNGSGSGISAIPKEQELERPIMQEDSSSQTDDSAAEAGTQWDNTWGDDTEDYTDYGTTGETWTDDNTWNDGTADNTWDNGTDYYADDGTYGNTWGDGTADNTWDNGVQDNTWTNNTTDYGYGY